MVTRSLSQQKQAREYGRIRRRLWLADTLFSAIYAFAWLLFGWTIALREWLLVLTDNDWILIALYVLVFGGVYSILNFPLTYYREFIVPHRFLYSYQTFQEWAIDQIKGLVIGVPLGLLLLELLYFALRVTGNVWWLWAAGGMLIFTLLLSNLSPVFITPLFSKYAPLGDEYKELADRVLKLAERANTKVRFVLQLDLSRWRKYTSPGQVGLGNTHRITLGNVWLKERGFTTDELETMLAHELGSHLHGDMQFLIAFGTISTTFSLYLASLVLNWSIHYFNFISISDVAAFPLLGLIFGAYGLITQPVDNAISRWRVNMADDYALQLTGKNEAFASALMKLGNEGLTEDEPAKWVIFMFYTHPPIAQRIAKAQNWKKKADLAQES